MKFNLFILPTIPASLLKNSNVEWFGWSFDQGLLPWDEAKRQIELFGKHIIPEFKG